MQRKSINETQVSISIGILKWSDKQLYLKPVRDKRVAIKVKTNESYSNLLQKAISKFRTFHKDLLDTECEYVLTFENGDVANTIPGSTEEFTLNKYKEEIGKDFRSIVLFLTSKNDQTLKITTRKRRSTNHQPKFKNFEFNSFM